MGQVGQTGICQTRQFDFNIAFGKNMKG